MFTPRMLLGMLALILVMSAGVNGEDKKEKGKLPIYWSKLGLSDEQKQKVFAIEKEYKEKIADLDAKLKDLHKSEKTELEKVLTDEQKDHLRKLLLEKGPAETPKDPAKTTETPKDKDAPKEKDAPKDSK